MAGRPHSPSAPFSGIAFRLKSRPPSMTVSPNQPPPARRGEAQGTLIYYDAPPLILGATESGSLFIATVIDDDWHHVAACISKETAAGVLAERIDLRDAFTSLRKGSSYTARYVDSSGGPPRQPGQRALRRGQQIPSLPLVGGRLPGPMRRGARIFTWNRTRLTGQFCPASSLMFT